MHFDAANSMNSPRELKKFVQLEVQELYIEQIHTFNDFLKSFHSDLTKEIKGLQQVNNGPLFK